MKQTSQYLSPLSLFLGWSSLYASVFVIWLLLSGRFSGFYTAPEFHPGFGGISWLTPPLAYTLLMAIVVGLLGSFWHKTQTLGYLIASVGFLALLLADKLAYLNSMYLVCLFLIWSTLVSYKTETFRLAKWMGPLLVTLCAVRYGLTTASANQIGASLTGNMTDVTMSIGILGFFIPWLPKTQLHTISKKAAVLGCTGLLIPLILWINSMLNGPLWAPVTHYFTFQYISANLAWDYKVILLPVEISKPPILLNAAPVFGPYTGRIGSDMAVRKAYLSYLKKQAPIWWKVPISGGHDEVFWGVNEGPLHRF